MTTPSYIAFLSIGVIALAISFFLSFKKYLLLKHEKYSLMNHFPFELNIDDYFRNNLLGNILFLFSRVMILSLFLIYVLNNHYGSLFAVGVFGLLTSSTSIASYLLSLRKLKGHIVFQTLSSISLFATSFLLAYFEYGVYINDNENIVALVVSILLTVISILYLVAVVIPKNTYNIKFDEINNDGVISYKRPKSIYTCIIEWVTIFLSYVIPLLLIIIETVK